MVQHPHENIIFNVLGTAQARTRQEYDLVIKGKLTKH